MTVREILLIGTKKLKSTLDAEVLLSHVLDRPREYLFANPGKQISPKQEKEYLTLVSRRQLGWPAAYLTGSKEFFGHKFRVDQRVLIPRPETETLVELVLGQIKTQKSKVKILDVGTGSGNIIISLAKRLGRHRSYYASDVSKKALAVAKQNALKHGVRITFKQGSLLQPWKNRKFDIIVANLPYGWKQWKNNTLTDTIGLKFEPATALFTKDTGLYHIRNLLKQLALSRWQMVFLEFDPRQTVLIKNLAEKYLPGSKVKIYKDLAGRNRFVQIKTAV